MAPLPPLATVEQLEDWLQVPRGSAPVNTVNLALAIASDMVRREAKTTFTVRTMTAPSRLIESGVIHLPGPVQSVAEVMVEGTALAEGSGWQLEGDSVRLLGKNQWYCGRARVTWTFGWPVVPMEIVGLVLDVTARACVNPKNLRQESTGQRSITFAAETLATSLAPVEVDKLHRYRPHRSLTSRWRE